jgi:hypothetical protein
MPSLTRNHMNVMVYNCMKERKTNLQKEWPWATKPFSNLKLVPSFFDHSNWKF